MAAALALLGAGAWALLGTAGLAVRQVEVSGVQRVPAAAVREAVAPELGRSLFLTDLDAVARRVRELPGVRAVDVTRAWPAGLVITVEERAVAAALPTAGGVRLVDAEGVDVGSAPRPPAGVPVLRVDPQRAAPGAAREAVAVHRGMPPRVRELVAEVGARTPDAVWLRLRDGSRVTWGSSRDGDLKAAVLLALRRGAPGGPAVAYDLTAPTAPSVSHRAGGTPGR